MTFSRTSRLPVLAGLLCLLLMGFAGASYGAVRFDVVPSPTEVINTGNSEVLGSVNLIVRGTGNVTGTSTGGATQIGIIYQVPVDNTTATGIRVFSSAGFASAAPSILSVANVLINGKCSGFITLNLNPGSTPAENDYIRVEGVRGRIAGSAALTPGTDIFAQLQSINDPSANSFQPDTVRVAKSLDGMNVSITRANLLLCFPSTGVPTNGTATPGYSIKITEGFARAFVDIDSANDGNVTTDRVDTGNQLIGAPTQSTQFLVMLSDIPASVNSIEWPAASSADPVTGAQLVYTGTNTFVGTDATAVYAFQTPNQTGGPGSEPGSDQYIETFTLVPKVLLKSGSLFTGTVNAAVSLYPTGGRAACEAPGAASTVVHPRFLFMPESDSDSLNNPPGDAFLPYAAIIRCNCFMLFTYVTSSSAFNTGISVANTTGDTQVFGAAQEAPDQVGRITFYFYSTTGAFRGSFTTGDIPSGQSWLGLVSSMLGTANMPDTTFSGYIIAKAEFQFCHALAFIADTAFAAQAQGYLANIIPDPAIKNPGGRRMAADAGDITNLPAGEGLNN